MPQLHTCFCFFLMFMGMAVPCSHLFAQDFKFQAQNISYDNSFAGSDSGIDGVRAGIKDNANSENTGITITRIDDNGYLAPYLANWGDTSKQFARCNNQLQRGSIADANGHFLLGNCPSFTSINLFYASTAIIHYTAANLLPQRYSRVLKDSSVNMQLSLFKEYSSFEMSVNF